MIMRLSVAIGNKRLHMKYYSILVLFLNCLLITEGKGRETITPVGDWWFWPDYVLENKAENYPGPRIKAPATPIQPVNHASFPLLFYGEEPTERILNFLESKKLPSGPFTIEMWMVNHVNQPIGALVTVKSKNGAQEPSWLLGYYDKEIVFALKTKESPFSDIVSHSIAKRGWKSYWMYIVAVFDGKDMALYLNGELVNKMNAGTREQYPADEYELEVAAYMKNEPYMELGNLLKNLRIYDKALDFDGVNQNFTAFKNLVVEGKLYPDLFHFNAGPYLNYATQNSMRILWETDRPASAFIEYGESVPLDKKIEVSTLKIPIEKGEKQEDYIHEVMLDNLKRGTTYFYNVRAVAADGTSIESGVLTFQTAVAKTAPFSFAVSGDTEARPHINNRIAKQIWEERPNFLLHVGDMTDGGKADHKFEWNYEFFAGITQLTSRVPIFPVPGNGEDDLFWYKKYHALPGNESYYNFRYGNAEFFMLNSNEKEDFKPGGKQYLWLEEKLKNSTATWKFVAHHHAPYSADEDDYGDSWKGSGTLGDLDIRKIAPLYEKYEVDMVLFGHLHTYQRTLPIKEGMVNTQNGVIYVQGGGGGGNLEDFAPSRAWFSAKTYRGHHYFTVNIFRNTLNLKMYDSDGRLKDYLDIEK